MKNTANNAAVITLAGRLYGAFTQGTRDNGKTFGIFDKSGPDGGRINTLIEGLHDGALPNDLIYDFAVDALALIEEQGETTDLDQVGNEIQSDPATFDLLQWAATYPGAVELVDDLARESGYPKGGLWELLSNAQAAERQRVFGVVLAMLREAVEEGEE